MALSDDPSWGWHFTFDYGCKTFQNYKKIHVLAHESFEHIRKKIAHTHFRIYVGGIKLRHFK